MSVDHIEYVVDDVLDTHARLVTTGSFLRTMESKDEIHNLIEAARTDEALRETFG